MKKALKIILTVFLIIVIVVVAGFFKMFGQEMKAMNSIKKLEDGLYFMEYKGDYGFEEFLERGGASSDDEMAVYITEFLSKGFFSEAEETGEVDNGCSTLIAHNEAKDQLMGRNFDWKKSPTLIIHTVPDNGYESYSTANMAFLGYENEYNPSDIMSKMMGIAAIYVPMDGMNEKGLVIADLMAGDDDGVHQDTDKPDLTTVSGLRMVLDYAANVDEAVSLLSQYDMNASIGAAHHYSISDASGKSVTVEYVDGQMQVTETPILTNHYLAEGPKKDVGSENSHMRFEMLTEELSACESLMTEDDMRNALKSVSCGAFDDDYEITCWSVVYNKTARKLKFFFAEDYENLYEFEIE